MRLPIVVLALLAAAVPGFAGDELRPVTESEALAEVRAVLDCVRAQPPNENADPAAYRLLPASFSRETFGKAYADLPESKRRIVDRYARLVLAGPLIEVGERISSGRRKPALTTQAVAGGARQVSCRIGRHEALYRVARTPAGHVAVVDVGQRGVLLGAVLRPAWTLASARKAEGATTGDTLVRFVTNLLNRTKEKILRVKAKDSLRVLITLMIMRRAQLVKGGFPPYGGRSFVLSVVAYGSLDISNAEYRSVLFGPTVPAKARAEAAAYKEVTKTALAEGRDWSKKMLTTHAGRRNDEAKYKITAADEKRGTVILADLSFEDVVIAGYTDGKVKVLTRDDLGLAPGDPFTVGEKAKSELLRKLSLR